MKRCRLQSKSEWGDFVRRAQRAHVDELLRCVEVIRDRSFKLLSLLSYERLAEIETFLAQGVEARSPLSAEAEAADNLYLDALDNNDGFADESVLRKFAIALALAAITWTYDADPKSAVLEGAYELSVTSDQENARLRKELDACIPS
jgi:hypothetical protein